MVATDLAARGLDFPGTIDHVINFDMPGNAIDYLHRYGPNTPQSTQCLGLIARLGREPRTHTAHKLSLCVSAESFVDTLQLCVSADCQ
jgi:hypothetical protein